MKSVALHNKLTMASLLKSFVLFLVFAFSLSSYSQNIDKARQKEGEKLFKSLCAACHTLDKKVIGPALGGIEKRQKNSWLRSWIKDNAKLRASGDKDALAIFKEFNGVSMTLFPQLTNKNIDDILYYTTVGGVKKKPEVIAKVGAVSSEKPQAPGWVIYLLGAAIVVAFLMIASLLKQVSELRGGRGDLQEFWIGIKNNTYLKGLTVVFLLLIGAYFVFGNLFIIGVDQGYQPIQPIAFSHKIHAGDNKIDCQYCHFTAKHSKTSGIPPVNVCMNCHKFISGVAKDTKVVLDNKTYVKKDLDKEIGKIYKAAGWDVNNFVYTGKTQPIKWTRVNNLPDFVYFNHSQHVTVAGVECQKCHGPVQKMEEVRQFAPLTMGWCIDCHKKTQVNLKGNGYYKKIHEQLAKKYHIEKVTIAQLGGKECGKCHY